jgi:Flp pilus assembly protein TadG
MRITGGRGRRVAPDRGSAIVEVVLVLPLLVLVAVAVLQVGLALHVRSTLTAAAADGARVAALAGADPAAGIRRTRALLADNLAGSVVRAVTARSIVVDGLPVMAVRVDADLPLVGLIGPSSLSVVGHAVLEGWQ